MVMRYNRAKGRNTSVNITKSMKIKRALRKPGAKAKRAKANRNPMVKMKRKRTALKTRRTGRNVFGKRVRKRKALKKAARR